jgi:large subunit ribosomal protein L9
MGRTVQKILTGSWELSINIMQVILIKDVDNLGQAHELVTVKSGYARNFLIPQKFAIEASPSNLKQMNEKLKVKAKKEAALLAQINEVVEVLKGSPVKIGAKTGTTDKIFGRVTSLQIARAIKEQKGYELDRKRIAIPEEVKEIGLHKATIDFGNGNITEIEFEVIAE